MSRIVTRLNSLTRCLLGALPARTGLRLLTALNEAQGAVEPDILHLPRHLPFRRAAVDIGANNGVTTMIFARHFAQVHAFEANPDLAARVRPGLPAHATLHAVALSTGTGRAELRIPVSSGVALEGWASLDRPQVGDEAAWKRVAVETRSLDSYALHDVDLIKIDVEGHELAVLAGASETIARCRPAMIVEVWEQSREAVSRWMTTAGYHPVTLKSLCGVDGAPNNLIFLPEPSPPTS